MFPEQNYITAALMQLPATTTIRIANEVRPPSSYLFSQFLPEEGRPTYDTNSATLSVQTTMAGLTGTSSNYPPGGFIKATTRSQKTAKIANHVEMKEEDLRILQTMIQQFISRGERQVTILNMVRDTLLDFYNKLVLQAHLDTMEFLRGQALVYGRIDWINNNIRLQADYGVPAANKNPQRTGNDAYGGSASKFWDDIRFIQRRLKYQVRAILMHPETFDLALYNPVNRMELVDQQDDMVRIKRIIESPGGNERISSDQRDQVTIYLYGSEASKVNEADITGDLLNVPFLFPGRVVGIGRTNTNRWNIGRYAVGTGSTPDPYQFLPIGYTHIAPTVEGNGQIGRWGRMFVPEAAPWSIVGEGVHNGLPVLDNPELIAHTSTVMS